MGGLAAGIVRAKDEVGEVLQRIHVRSPPPHPDRLLDATSIADTTLSPRRVRRWLDGFNVLLRNAQLTVEGFMSLTPSQQQAYYLGWRIPHVKSLVLQQAMQRHLSSSERSGIL
jgi:hypothetical protein